MSATAPRATRTAACTTDVRDPDRAVTKVTQCNASTNGGGGTLRCSVVVTNRFIGIKIGQVQRDDQPVRRLR